MPTPICDPRTSFKIWKLEQGRFKYLRNISLSNDYKKVIIEKYINPTTDPTAPSQPECEIDIDNQLVGLKLNNFDLVIETPKPISDCSAIVQMKHLDNTPKIMLREETVINFIGIEDIRIGYSENITSFPFANGLNITSKNIDGTDYTVIEIWE